MAWSWANFSAQLGRVLNDSDEGEPIHSESVRLDGLNAALRAAVAYCPAQSLVEDEDVSEVELEEDTYAIAAVVVTSDDETQVLQPASVSGAHAFLDVGSYWVWEGTVSLNSTYDTVKVYYHAYYPEMDLEVDDIPVPIWARDAIVYRAAAHCLMPNLSSRARLGAYNDREDAQPLQNSLIQAADWFIKQFERIMTEHKGTT